MFATRRGANHQRPARPVSELCPEAPVQRRGDRRSVRNGTGVGKNEAAAVKYLKRAAHKGNQIAQNRLARVYMMGRGVAADPVQAMKWHIAAKAGGLGDPQLDEFMAKQSPEQRAAAEKAASEWVAFFAAARS